MTLFSCQQSLICCHLWIWPWGGNRDFPARKMTSQRWIMWAWKLNIRRSGWKWWCWCWSNVLSGSKPTIQYYTVGLGAFPTQLVNGLYRLRLADIVSLFVNGFKCVMFCETLILQVSNCKHLGRKSSHLKFEATLFAFVAESLFVFRWVTLR